MNNFSIITNSMQQIHGKQLMKLCQDTNLVYNFKRLKQNNKTYIYGNRFPLHVFRDKKQRQGRENPGER